MSSTRVSMKIPAVAANLGPGYSTLSMALAMYNDFYIEEIESGIQITNQGPYSRNIPVSQMNLVYRAAKKLFEHVGYKYRGMRIVSQCNIPEKRGLCSSTTAVIAGLVAANRIARAALDRSEICTLATQFDEFPEAISCTLLGGLTMTVQSDEGHVFMKLPVPGDMEMLLAIPDFEVSSREYRISIPRKISLKDAVFNSSRMGVFIASLFTGEYNEMSLGLEDRIHFPALKKTIPVLSEISLIANGDGAYGLSICGEGSSFIVFYRENGKQLVKKIREAFKRYRIRIRIMKISVDNGGTIIEQE